MFVYAACTLYAQYAQDVLLVGGGQRDRLRSGVNSLNNLISKTSDVIGVKLDPLMMVSERSMLLRVKTILSNESNLVQRQTGYTTENHLCFITAHSQCLTLRGSSDPGLFLDSY